MDQSLSKQRTNTTPASVLTELESEVSQAFPGEVFDYPYILTPENSTNVTLNAPLNSQQIKLLTKYNEFGQKYFSDLGIEIDLPSDAGLFEKYLEFSRNLYLVRFVEARKLFGQYSLFAIPTLGALEISRKSDDLSENTMSMEIFIPEAFVINDNGSFNFEDSVSLEKQTNLIRRTLSSFGNFIDLANKSIPDLLNITTRSFLISMNEQVIIDTMQVALQNLIIEVNKSVYEYLDRGFPPQEARENVVSMLKQSTSSRGTLLPRTLNHMQQSTEELIQDALSDHIKIEKSVQDDLFTEIMELIVHYCFEGELVSQNIYKLVFTPYDDLPSEYQRYHHVVEVFLMDDEGDTLSVPNEAYDIDFSRKSKEAIFRLVTNGFENPQLPLNNYLYRV